MPTAYRRSGTRPSTTPRELGTSVELADSPMPRVALILRLGPGEVRPERKRELERLFAGPVQVRSTAIRDPDTLTALAQGTDVVIVDAVPRPLQPPIIAALGGALLLRPIWETTRTRRGEPQPTFRGYGRLEPDGTVSPLADGAMTVA